MFGSFLSTLSRSVLRARMRETYCSVSVRSYNIDPANCCRLLTVDTFVWCTEGLNSYVRSLPAAAAKKLRKTTSLLQSQLPRRPATQKQQSKPTTTNIDDVIRCSRCGGIEYIIVDGVEQPLKGDVICACGDDTEIPQLHSDEDLDADASYQNDDQLASTSTPY